MDAAEYRKTVLKPFRADRRPELVQGLTELNEGKSLPSKLDLVFLYDVTEDRVRDDRVCAAHIDEVSNIWALSLNNANYRDIAPTLIQLHKSLTAAQPGLKTAGFWKQRLQAARAAKDVTLAELAAVLKVEYAAYGVITPERLAAAAESIGGLDRTTEARLAEVAQSAGLTVVQPFTIPEIALPAGLSALNKSRYVNLVQAILGDRAPASFKIVDRFQAAGAPGLTVQAVTEAQQEMRRKPAEAHNDAVIELLGAIAQAAPTDERLHALVLRHLVDMVERSGQLASVAVTRLERAGVDRTDAGRIVLQAGVKGATVGPSTVEEKLFAGALKEARLLLDQLMHGAQSPALDRAAAMVVEAEKRVESLRRQALEAERAGRIDDARTALAEATRLCREDEELEAMLAALPPGAPYDVVLSPLGDGQGLKVLWKVGADASAQTRYRVVRKLDVPPRDTRDGDPVGDDLTGTELVDRQPPIARQVWYGVSASRGGSPSSVTSESIMLLPTVTDVRSQADQTSATLEWRNPDRATSVSVVETDSSGRQRSLQPTSTDTLTVDNLRTGEQYTYAITAHYRGVDASLLSSRPVSCQVVARAEAQPVRVLVVEPKAGAVGKVEVEAVWRNPVGHQVEIWHLPSQPSWRFGQRIAMADITGAGAHRLSGRVFTRGSRSGVTAEVPPGMRVYVALTRDGDSAVVGQSAELGICPPVTSPVCDRFGSEAVIKWDWPGEDVDVAVEWKVAGKRRQTVINRAQYLERGGLRLDIGLHGAEIELRTTVATDDEDWASAPVRIQIPAAPPRLEYHVEWRPKKLLGKTARVIVTFSAPEALHGARVVVVAGAPYLPSSLNDCVELERKGVSVDAPRYTCTEEITFEVMRKPYFIRVLPEDARSLLVVDPPTSELRGR